MSDLHPSPAAHQRGWRGELRLQRELDQLVAEGRIQAFMQPEALVIPAADAPFLIEAKDQDRFKAPPFDGHGLPVWQVALYERARAATGLRTMFLVYDGPDCFRAWLDELERGPHFDTAGTIKRPRRIYPLTSYARRAT